MTITQTEVFPSIKFQYPCGVLCLLLSSLYRTARSHLTTRHVECTGPVPKILHLQKRPADGKFDVVRVSKNRQYVYLIHQDKSSTTDIIPL